MIKPISSLRLSRTLQLSRLQLKLFTVIWISVVHNWAVLQAFASTSTAGQGWRAWAFVGGGWAFTIMVLWLLMLVFSALFWGHRIRWVCAAMLIMAAPLSYFTLFLGTQFDKTMLLNMLQTHTNEALELLNPRIVVWTLLLGVLPAVGVMRIKIKPSTSIHQLTFQTLMCSLLIGGTALGAIYAQYSRYATVTRNKVVTFHMLAPANLVAAGVSLGYQTFHANRPLQPKGLDARQTHSLEKPRLIVMILGETARAMNHGLNGYERNTTPRMQAAGGHYFANTQSCGTATAISVPCIFSGLPRSSNNASTETFSLNQAQSQETLIDVVRHAGVRVLWLDNDSGCKGVCKNAQVEDMTASNHPKWCPEPGECHDELLLDNLQGKITAQPGDTLLVLHLKGSHGPAYYKRYPKAFEQFTPTCQTNDLSACDLASLRNAYDNTILYSDHMVGEVIDLLKQLQDRYTTAMLYVSDHGESLGESGLFLHGMPYAFAPIEQKQVPMYVWTSPSFMASNHIDTACMKAQTQIQRSHDHVYPSILGMLNIATSEYHPELDLLSPCTTTRNTDPKGASPHAASAK